MQSYDLYISIGRSCRSAEHLRRHGLRSESYPLDWQLAYSLDTVIHLFQTSFADFFVDIEEDLSAPGSGKNRRVVDKKNHIISIHHFPLDMTLKEAQTALMCTTQKRFERLNQRIKKAKNIILMSNRTDSPELFEQFLNDFFQIYPHLTIKLLNVRTDPNLPDTHFSKESFVFSERLSMDDYSFNDTFDSQTGEKFEWRGNIKHWDKVLNSYASKDILTKMEKLQRKSVVIYGAGKQCKDIVVMLKKYGVDVQGIAVADTIGNPEFVEGIKVQKLEDFDKDSYLIVSIKDKEEQVKIKNSLCARGYHDYLLFDSGKGLRDL